MSQEATMEQVINELGAAARKVARDQNKPKKYKAPSISWGIAFLEEETSRMEPVFAYSFEERGRVAHITKEKRKNGKFLYTIKYIFDSYNIAVKNSDLRKAKKAFISKTWEEAA